MEHQKWQIETGIYEEHPNNPHLPITYRFSETLIGNLTLAHWHEHIEILCVLQGNLRVYIQGTIIDAIPGDLIIINPGETHSIPEREDNSRYECLIPHKALCDKMGLEITDHPIENHIQNNLYFTKFQQIMNELREKPPFFEINVQLSLLELLVSLMREYPKNAAASKKISESSGEHMVKQAIQYIQKYYAQPISTNDVCQYLGFDKSYICSTFKKITGTTIVSFINMIRCEHAKELLQIGKLSVSECAFLCGFQHFPYFTKTYKRYIGELPSATLQNNS